MPASGPALRSNPSLDALLEEITNRNSHLRALARRMLRDESAVDDALQEAFLRAHRALPKFRGESSMSTWLYRIVRNVCLDEIRRRARERADGSGEDLHHPVSADTADGGAERADLAAALTALPPAFRATVLLVDGWDMDYETAGAMLGIAPGTVGSRLSRARADLRTSLAVAA